MANYQSVSKAEKESESRDALVVRLRSSPADGQQLASVVRLGIELRSECSAGKINRWTMG